MAQQTIALGSGPDTPGADSRYDAFTKVNANFVELYGATLLPSSAKTSSYTLVLADGTPGAGAIEMDMAGTNTVTVPPNSSVAFPVGTVIEVCQVGAGTTTVVAGAGVTLRNPGTSLALRARWSSVTLRKRATDEWVVAGDTA
jgi:hypothetical protein